MIMAIDETGSFSASSNELHFFVGIHLRQRKTLYKIKQRQFTDWEAILPSSLKNAKGEIKSSLLSQDQLFGFSKKVIVSNPIIRVTPIAINPIDNPKARMDKYRKQPFQGSTFTFFYLQLAWQLKHEAFWDPFCALRPVS